MKLPRVFVVFGQACLEGRVSQEMPSELDEGDTHYESAIEVVYTDGQPSVPHYQVARLIKAAQNLGDSVLVVTDQEDRELRSVATIYLGHAVGS